jgi:hypothetical protein
MVFSNVAALIFLSKSIFGIIHFFQFKLHLQNEKKGIYAQCDTIINIFSKYTNFIKGYVVANWLRHYATSRKVAGSRPDEVNDFFIWPILPTALGPEAHSVTNRNEAYK